MTGTTANHTIEKLRHCFATFGLPNTVVTDGGPQFRSEEFYSFLKHNGVHHIFTPPYHPASNGLAERAVQTVKDAFRKQMLHDAKHNCSRSTQHRIDSFLFVYRNTPHSITGMTPSEAITHLNPLKPHLASEIEVKQDSITKLANKNRGKPRNFNLGEQVLVRSVRKEIIRWHPGVVTKIISPVTYLVKVEGRTRFAHADHLRTSHLKSDEEEDDPREIYSRPKEITLQHDDAAKSPSSHTRPLSDAVIRRSQRTCRMPAKLDL
ncbi:uncharacterized protein K02A2.6-like [Macrosteles quadrilineatus]|uniref:uncharacterized protein K02A2.6-like n=1 Tax=Macrosteles quadrilineatus TaxID=74068 RepID=UPI0023E1B0AC|nr:uncharacterized protein K02A2.6-like [Macrosteles quadrilineatus]